MKAPMKIVFVLKEAPYGSDEMGRCYNDLLLVGAVRQNEPDAEILVFLSGDAVLGLKKSDKKGQDRGEVETMLQHLVAANIRVWVCDTCMESLGLADSDLIAGSRRANIAELGRAVLEADKFITW
jgi:sulfur relay (sulfurtransferase) complex TusBCD TusD component (DsrE family)